MGADAGNWFSREGRRGLWRGLSHSRRLSRAVGGVSLSPEGSRRLGARHADAGARWARSRELLTTSWDREPVAARGAGERGRRCWQLRRALPARLGRASSEMRGAQASVGRHQAAMGSGQEAPDRKGMGWPPAVAGASAQRSWRDPEFLGFGPVRVSVPLLTASQAALAKIPQGDVNRLLEPPGVVGGRANLAASARWTGALESSPLQHPCWLWLLSSWWLALGTNLFLKRSSVAVSSTRVA